ncbi:MAG: hypothetical protein IT381_06800 [Deltaproteobacteria bacterium]|nr:hypothetical protein [Deltaproteobacteria bacterium]
MRKPVAALAFPLALALFSAGCEDEAILHPPPPPATPVRELGSAAPPAEVAAASKPVAKVEAAAKQKMTLQMFMEDHVEPAARRAAKTKKADPALEALLRQLGALMPEELRATAQGPKKPWDAIVDATLSAGAVPKYGLACKQCHALWKKPYKKTFRKREIDAALPPSTGG